MTATNMKTSERSANNQYAADIQVTRRILDNQFFYYIVELLFYQEITPYTTFMTMTSMNNTAYNSENKS